MPAAGRPGEREVRNITTLNTEAAEMTPSSPESLAQSALAGAGIAET